MNDRTTRSPRLIRWAAWLVPASRRSDWQRQWDADLGAQARFLSQQGHSSRSIRADLSRRSLGAVSHAAWLRVHQWRTFMTFQDFRYALRGFAQRPGLSAAIVVTLGLAVGSITTIFSWMDALVLNPLPGVPRASELGLVRFATPTRSDLSFSYPNFRDVRDAAPAALEGIAVQDMLPATARIDDRAPQRVWVELASGNFFDVLEVGPQRGRVLQLEDETQRRHVAVISHAFWESDFQSDPNVVGRAISVNGHAMTIVGVAPRGFRGGMGGLTMDVWLPLTVHPQLTGRSVLELRGNGWLSAIARLGPGVTTTQAEAQLRAVSDRMIADGLIDTNRRLRIGALTEDGAATVLLPIVSILMGLVVLVLLIACANVSGLLLSRAVARQQELSIRTALGAGRARLMRQLLVESLILSVAGGLAGVLLATWTSQMLQALLPPLPYPVLIESGVNLRVLAFSLAIVVIATMLFGLAPALQASRTRLTSAVRASRASTTTPQRARLRGALVVSQVALALVLLVCTGLFVRTLFNAYDVDPGFTRREAVLASFDLSSLGYDQAKGTTLIDELLNRLETTPGIEAATVTTYVPLSAGGRSDTSPVIDGYTPSEQEEITVPYAMVGQNYFETMGVRIVAGRAIDERDRATSAPVVVINETMARRYWSGREAVGGRLRTGRDWMTVVGVAQDGKGRSLSEPAGNLMYFPIHQVYRPNVILSVATTGPAPGSIGAVRKAVADVAPDLAIYDVLTLEEHLRLSVAVPRMAAMLLGIFGTLALILSAVGVYGVIAFSASQRTQEIGVRMALGADRSLVLRQILSQGAKLTALGLLVGLAGAAAAAPLLASQLVNVSPTDPITFASTALGLLTIALFAAWIPARRAASIDPVRALRGE